MKNVMKLQRGKKWVMGIGAFAMVLFLGFGSEIFTLVSHATNQCKVTASSANIRKDADTKSTAVASVLNGAELTIKSQTTGTDGKVWYYVFVDANTLGYVRSDLVKITDGSTPPTSTATPKPSSAPAVEEEPATVEALNPVSGKVKGSDSVRVRANASTTSKIKATVKKDSAITVTGRATGKDNKTWYQVNFISDGTEVVGFIRSDYVAVSGELTPYVEEPIVPEVPDVPEPSPEPVVQTKLYETMEKDGIWYLINNEEGNSYTISSFFEVEAQNQQYYEEITSLKRQVSGKKTLNIILVILLAGAAGGGAYLFYRFKDKSDSAYINAVERETLRRRSEARAQSGNQRVMHTVGADKNQKPAGNKPVGARPTGAAQPVGNRPVGARPTGAAQPVGNRPTGDRPTGAAQSTGNRPAEARPTGANPGWKPKNFLQEDDDFEYEFLNWDGEEDK